MSKVAQSKLDEIHTLGDEFRTFILMKDSETPVERHEKACVLLVSINELFNSLKDGKEKDDFVTKLNKR
jgi:hypothetical protein